MLNLKRKTAKETPDQPKTPEMLEKPKAAEQVNRENNAGAASSQASSIEEESAEPDWETLGIGEGTAEEAEIEAEQGSDTTMMLGPDEFHTTFCGCLVAASHLTGLQSLMVEETDGKAVACTKALYDTILDVPALHFLLMPQNKWLDRTLSIGMFIVPMVVNVRAEIAVKKQMAAEAAKRAKQQQQASGEQGSSQSKQDKSGKVDIPDFDMSGKNEKV